MADTWFSKIVDKGLYLPGSQLVQTNVAQGRIGTFLQLMEPGYAAGPQTGDSVLLKPLFAEGFKLYRAAPALARALFIKQNPLPLDFLFNLLRRHTRGGLPGGGADHLFPVGIVAAV